MKTVVWDHRRHLGVSLGGVGVEGVALRGEVGPLGLLGYQGRQTGPLRGLVQRLWDAEGRGVPLALIFPALSRVAGQGQAGAGGSLPFSWDERESVPFQLPPQQLCVRQEVALWGTREIIYTWLGRASGGTRRARPQPAQLSPLPLTYEGGDRTQQYGALCWTHWGVRGPGEEKLRTWESCPWGRLQEAESGVPPQSQG